MNGFEKRFHDCTFDAGIVKQARRPHPLCAGDTSHPPLRRFKYCLPHFQPPSNPTVAGLVAHSMGLLRVC